MAKTHSTSSASTKPKSRASSPRSRETIASARLELYRKSAKDAGALAFVHSTMAQIGLPRSPQEGRVWACVNGAAGLVLEAGHLILDGKLELLPLPQGSYPRLILADVAAYALRHKTPTVDLGPSASSYMRERLGMHVNAGERGTYTVFRREARALAAANMTLTVPEANGMTLHVKAPPIEQFRSWRDEGEVWVPELQLGRAFYESLREHAVPIDMRAYRALSHSALGQDIYAWLSQRLCRLKSPQPVYWSALASQFGGGYADVKEFRREFLRRLLEVQQLYRDAQVEVVTGRRGVGGALVLKPSKPPIPKTRATVAESIAAKAQQVETRAERERRQQAARDQRDHRKQQLAVRRREAGALRVVEGGERGPQKPP